MKKIMFTTIAILVVGLSIFAYIWYYLPFSDEGTKIGQLNDFRHKGIIFKTYEGRLIQTGIRSTDTGNIQSNMFEFSVDDKRIAEQLRAVKNQQVVKLHYKEYFGRLPWRGYTQYIVDSVEVSNEQHNAYPPFGN